jgi:hypothetical protein
MTKEGNFEAFIEEGAIYATFCGNCGAPPDRYCVCPLLEHPRKRATSRLTKEKS